LSPAYELLARVYDGGWFSYSEYVAELISEIEKESRRTFRSVCDAACGTGLLLYWLRQNGSDAKLAGFDLSPEMLARARERVPDARLREGDLREFPLHGPFDLVTCVYDSLNYLLDPRDAERFFRAARGRLRSDGLLLVDFNTSVMYGNRHGLVQPHLIGGIGFREEIAVDPGPPPIVTTTFTFPEGQEVHRQRIYEADEVEDLLRESGFLIVDTLDVMDAEDDTASGKVICTAVVA
jgi:SAM-dependent methyltransferase